MVTKKSARSPYVPAVRNSDGAWLCNVVADCDGLAVQQASPDVLPECAGGCNVAGVEMRRNVDERKAELAAAVAREDDIKHVAKTRGASPVAEAADILDQLELRAIAERRRLLGSEIEGITAALARVLDDHTHPLYACDKHAARLPQ